MNSLRREIAVGEVVIIHDDFFKESYTGSHAFRCEGGFGMSAVTSGRAIMGTFVEDGEQARINGSDIDAEKTDAYQEANHAS